MAKKTVSNETKNVLGPDYFLCADKKASEITRPGIKLPDEYLNAEVIDIPVGINTIGAGAFKGCTAVKKVFIAPTVKFIEKEAFMGCTSLESIVIPSSVCAALEWSFRSTGLKRIYVMGRSDIGAGHNWLRDCTGYTVYTHKDNDYISKRYGKLLEKDMPEVKEYVEHYWSKPRNARIEVDNEFEVNVGETLELVADKNLLYAIDSNSKKHYVQTQGGSTFCNPTGFADYLLLKVKGGARKGNTGLVADAYFIPKD